MAALWVYKCNSKSDAAGNWSYFFGRMRGKGTWGGTETINNASSLKLLREKLRTGDLVLAWQSNQRAAHGLFRIRKLDNKDNEISIVLDKEQQFEEPVKLLDWKKKSPALANGNAFAQGNAGTLFKTTTAEAKAIFRICRIQPSLLKGASSRGQPAAGPEYEEGAIREIKQELAYRDSRLRNDAIREKGCKCEVCGFDFGDVYGQLGQGYIEVHHLYALSKRRGRKTKTTLNDVSVVCSNCHRMLHRSGAEPMPIEELRELVKTKRCRGAS